ncbi:hypothetical protein ACLKA6_001251 [Drosophila palustris]
MSNGPTVRRSGSNSTVRDNYERSMKGAKGDQHIHRKNGLREQCSTGVGTHGLREQYSTGVGTHGLREQCSTWVGIPGLREQCGTGQCGSS